MKLGRWSLRDPELLPIESLSIEDYVFRRMNLSVQLANYPSQPSKFKSVILQSVVLILLMGGPKAFCAEWEVTAPPKSEVERLSLDPFYKKYTSVQGFPIIASEKVNDYALLETAYLIEQVIGHRPDILKAITDEKVRYTIMAPDEFTTQVPEHSHLKPKEYWDKRARGLGATPKAPAVSCGEENLLEYKGDPYHKENITIHEFAHVIHLMGLNVIDKTFQKRLEQTFNRATLKGLWKGKYAGTNPAEYWAEGVQSWFDTNRENDHDHNHVNTREELMEHDPGLAKLIEGVFGKPEWRYTKPSNRTNLGHLTGYDPTQAPTFEWPADMIAAYEALESGKGIPRISLRPLDEFKTAKSPKVSEISIMMTIQNRTEQRLELNWIDFQGKRKPMGTIDPTRKIKRQTYAGHVWVLLDEKKQPYALFTAGEEDSWLEAK